MATNFPNSLDNLQSPTGNVSLNDAQFPHSGQHQNANDAINALQAKVGITGSSDPNSLDYKIAQLAASAQTYIHLQSVPQSVWTVNHTLNKYPSVTIVDSGGNIVVGDVLYTSTSQVVISFSSGFGGTAYLN